MATAGHKGFFLRVGDSGSGCLLTGGVVCVEACGIATSVKIGLI